MLAGCSSTQPELNVENGEVVFPPLLIASNSVYVWDDSKFEALNVAHMALPAGVGNGLRDMDKGEDATTGNISGGSRLFESALGLAGSGLFGVLQSESLAGGVNRALDWKPLIVELMESLEVSDSNLVDYAKVRDRIATKIMEALEAHH